jgi:RND family efflux transporter MFP subunit
VAFFICKSMRFQTKIISLLVAITAVSGLLVFELTNSTKAQSNQPNQPTSTQQENKRKAVSVVSTTTRPDGLQTTGRITAKQNASVAGEISGRITDVLVDVGDRVSAGQVIARLSQENEKAKVRQAQANVQSQQARLEKLRSGPRPQEQANAQVAVRKAKQAVNQAQFNLFNTDLQAYVASGETAVRSGSLTPPTISGTYEGDESGRYLIRLYKSDTKSGYSFRYTGLEKGFGSASTDTPQPLGTRGLYIEFPDNFATNQLLRWEVPILNTRSPQYQQAKNNLTQARNQLQEARNNLSLTASGTRPEQINQQQAQVESAEAGVASAQSQLAKTVVTAPFSGVVQSVPVSPGDYHNVGQPIVELINTDSLLIKTSLSPQKAARISVGGKAFVSDGISATVVSKSPAAGEGGNIAVELQVLQPQQANLTAGTYVDITFTSEGASNGQNQAVRYLPLKAVSTRADRSFVYVVSGDGTARKVSVTTDSVTGQRVAVRGDISNKPVIRNADAVTAGQPVRVTADSRE